jgi:preprotein translocase subunit SecF
MLRPIQIIPAGTKFDFVGKRSVAYLFSLVLVLGSLVAFAVQGLNFGIDFRGGTLIEIKTEGPADITAIRDTIGGLGLGEVQVQEFGEPDDVLIRIQRQEGSEEEQIKAAELVKEAIKPMIAPGGERRVEFVGPTVGDELIEAAIWAISLALGAILVYVWFRFEWQFGVGAVIALTHDVISTIGLFAVTQLEFNLATVAAVLTIAGYSINDTVVIYDRVREELRRYKKLALPDLLNIAVNGTLSRTFMTSFTTLLALFALVALGGPIIRDFSLAMIWGIVIGTYSSVFIAVPVLLLLRFNREALTAGDGENAQAPDAPDGGDRQSL